ncbi:hypothetical protein SteCoe_2656 [Stentor coeruleus]|uniref:Ion transport domain-containing protein n=1 Tax=Stentor coeruleus TaxID=5963 RepID=A0A1R2CYV6_9CILI|nr:hypothetical protein SteCoe_2656 [Stentor coeruleus]
MGSRIGEDQSTLYDIYSYKKEPSYISDIKTHPKRLSQIQIPTFRYTPLMNETISNKEDSFRPTSEKFRANSILNSKLKDDRPESPKTETKTLQEIEDLKGYVQIRFKRKLELVEDYKDKYWFLEIRKAILTIWYSISEICLRIIRSKAFEFIVICVILMNTIVLALEDPNGQVSSEFVIIEDFFIYFYTAECIIKIIALGFVFTKGSYLRDKWNILDFIIIISAWMSSIGGADVKLSSLRTLRILRPLRSISSVKGIRALFLALFQSFKPLMSAFVVLFFFILIFSIAGLQLWSGSLKQRCVNIDEGTFYNQIPCGETKCLEGYICAAGLDNPNNGATNFDNILISMVMVFQILTLEGWTQILEWNQRSFSYLSILFYLPLVFIGANLIMNLSLAIITSSFTDAMQMGQESSKHQITLDFLDEEPKFETEPKTKATHRKRGQNYSESDLLSKNYESLESKQSQSVKLKFSKLRPNSIKNIAKKLNFKQPWNIEIESFDSIEWDNSHVMNKQLPEDFSPLPSYKNIDKNFKNIENKTKGSVTAADDFGAIKSLSSNSEPFSSNQPLNNQHRHALRRIRTALTIKQDFLSNYTGKYDSNFTPLISEFYRIMSNSSDDVVAKEIFPVFNMFYMFRYHVKFENENFEDLLHKYLSHSVKELKKILSKLYGIKKSFKVLKICAKEYVKNVEIQDEENQHIVGEWSGNDVLGSNDPMYISNLEGMVYKIWTSGWMSNYEKFAFVVKKIILYKHTTNIVTLAVIFNTACLSVDHYGISTESSQTLTLMNNFFTYFFAVELFLRIIGLGLKDYLRDRMNYFDTIVVILSIIEISFLSDSTSAISAFRAIRIFRIFRVLRVVRLLRYLKSMAHIVRAISKSLSNFGYLFLLLILFLIIFSLIGMKIYGGQFNFLEGTPRGNFDSFHWAFVTTFQVLTTENWNDILISSLRSDAGPASCLFLIVWVIIGNFIFLNLFLAILIESFSEDKDDSSNNEQTSENKLLSIVKKKYKKNLQILNDFEAENTSFLEEFDQIQATPLDKDFISFEEIQCVKSFYIFSKSNPIRISCYKIVSHPRFETITLAIIIINSGKLVWDTYLLDMPNDSTQKIISDITDFIFTGLFCTELILKSISMGFFASKGSYLKDNWNKLDLIIIIFSLIDASVTSVNIPIIKVFRLLRGLRPLKLISHNLSMKIVVIALIESLRAILNVLVVIIIIWLVFAILGVSLLGGKLYYCENNLINTQIECNAMGYNWVNKNANFDNVFEAMVTLFIVMSQESWPNRMFEGVDAVDIGIAPRINANPPMAYFYIVYFVIGNFFLVNLFTAVVFDKFTEAKKDQSSMAALILSKEQMNWTELQKMILDSKPSVEASHAPQNRIRAFFFYLSKSKAFEIIMMIVIMINMLVMALPYEGSSVIYTKILENINLALTFIFITEAGIKIIGLGFMLYIKNNWNKFDFFVAMSSTVDLIMEFSVGSNIKFLRSFPQLIRVLRVLRIARLLRLVKSLKSLQDLLMIIMYAMPAILNILSLLLLIFFIYAVLGSFLFHTIKKGKIVLGDFYNFSNFGFSMVVLWRISTGEDYPSIMYDCAHSLGSKAYYLYFISFLTLVDFVVLELFVSVIIQNYEEQSKNTDTVLQIFNKEIKKFRRCWSIYSFDTFGVRVDREKLIDFIYEYGPIFTDLKQNMTRIQIIKFIGSLDIKSSDDYYYYHDVVFALMKRKYGKKACKGGLTYAGKLLRMEEIKTNNKLEKLRDKARVHLNELSGDRGPKNLFFSILYMKNVFLSWKKYAKRKKNKSVISITPRFSECDYPGENSLNSYE